ncbi:MAG: hypothetical protein ACOZBZ_01270 [Patescibacteria group bacterium]
MKNFFLLTFFLFILAFPDQSLASSATAVTESQVEATGDVQVQQVVETTVDGQTVRKESREPGKLELEMKKTGGGQPTVTFSQESAQIITSPTPTPSPKPLSLITPIIDFVRKLLDI